MSLLEELGKVAGAIAAEQGVSNLDPNANFLEKTAAAIAGYEGTKIAEEKIGAAVDSYQSTQTDDVTSTDSLDEDAEQN